MGTRANTTLAWVTTGLVVITSPFLAFAGLDDEWQPPPAHVADLDAMDFDATLEPDTRVDTGLGAGLDTSVPGSDSGVTPGLDDASSGPRLPDGGYPTPLVADTAAAGCQCTQTRGDPASDGSPWLLALAAPLLLTVRRRRRDR